MHAYFSTNIMVIFGKVKLVEWNFEGPYPSPLNPQKKENEDFFKTET